MVALRRQKCQLRGAIGMNVSSNATPPEATRSPRVGRAALWLSLAVIGAWPVYAVVGYALYNGPGVSAAAVAALVCWCGALMALMATALLAQQAPVGSMLLGMMFRMGMPLVAAIALHNGAPQLARVGITGFILAYYLPTLALETLLAVRMIGLNKPASKAS
jgi:hypothetical protein